MRSGEHPLKLRRRNQIFKLFIELVSFLKGSLVLNFTAELDQNLYVSSQPSQTIPALQNLVNNCSFTQDNLG